LVDIVAMLKRRHVPTVPRHSLLINHHCRFQLERDRFEVS